MYTQIVSGRLQLRYNLGSGEALLQQNTIRVDDQQFHNITLRRTQRSAEILIDGLYINRTTSPGTEVTLNIATSAMYLGAGYNGSTVNGFVGCVTGLKLDEKDVPIIGSTHEFEILPTSQAIAGDCPIGTLFESPQPDHYVFPAIAAIILGLILISTCFVIVCIVGQWYRNRRRGEHTVNLRRNSTGSRSRRSWNYRDNSSPAQDTLQWQEAASFTKRDMGTPLDYFRSSPTYVPETAFNSNMNNRNLSLSPTQSNVVETGFSGLSHRASSRSHQKGTISQPQEGFVFSQSNQGYCEDIDSGQTSNGQTNQPIHVRTLSGQQSILSASTVATSSLHDNTEVTEYLRKRLEIANSEIVELNMDGLSHYKEEGPYQPLGSLGSLLDFVKELDSEPQWDHDPQQENSENECEKQFDIVLNQQERENYQFPVTPAVSRESTLTTYPSTNSVVPIVYQLHKPQQTRPQNQPGHSQKKTSPLTGQKFDESEEKVKDEVSIKPGKQGRGKPSKTTRSSNRDSRSMRMENILERFHNITAGHIPDEGRLI